MTKLFSNSRLSKDFIHINVISVPYQAIGGLPWLLNNMFSPSRSSWSWVFSSSIARSCNCFLVSRETHVSSRDFPCRDGGSFSFSECFATGTGDSFSSFSCISSARVRFSWLILIPPILFRLRYTHRVPVFQYWLYFWAPSL